MTSEGEAPARGTNAGLPSRQPAIEGLVDARHMPAGNQRTRDPWPPGRLSRVLDGRPQDRLDVQRHPERGKPGRHLAQAVDALAALLRQKRGQVRRGQHR